MERAGADLAKAGPEKLANSDAAALSSYLQALGLNVDADRVNRLLVLLAVLVIECGRRFGAGRGDGPPGARR